MNDAFFDLWRPRALATLRTVRGRIAEVQA